MSDDNANESFNPSTKTARSPPKIPVCGICEIPRPAQMIKCFKCGQHFHLDCAGVEKHTQFWTCKDCGPQMTLRSQKSKKPEAPGEAAIELIETLRQPSLASSTHTESDNIMAMLTVMMAGMEARMEQRLVQNEALIAEFSNKLSRLPEKENVNSVMQASNHQNARRMMEVQAEIHETAIDHSRRMPYNSTSLSFGHTADDNQPPIPRTPVPRPSVSGFGPSEAVSNVQNASYSLLDLSLRKEQLMLPKFSGDPGDWPLFISVYERTTTQFNLTNDENNARLQRSILGEAREMVKSFLIFPEMTPTVISTLKLFYGNARKLIESMVHEIQNLPDVTSRMDNLLLLTTKVQNMYHLAVTSDLKQHLSNPILVHHIENKLPSMLYVGWKKYQEEQKSESVETLHHFLSEQARLLGSLDTTSLKRMISKRSNNRDQVHVHSSPSSDSEESQKSRAYKKEQICVLNCKSYHPLQKCQRFVKMDSDKRLALLQTYKICWNCLRTHIPRRCDSKINCNVNECKFRHHPLLHDALQKRNKLVQMPVIETVGEIESISESDTEMVATTSANSGTTILFKILPVMLHSKKKSIMTYAFLDEGSTVTMIDEEIARKLELDGPKSALNLKWTGQTTKCERDSKKVTVEIGAVAEKGKKFALHNVRTVKELDLPIQSLKYSKENVPYRHLQNLPIQAYQNAQPKILIGLQHVQMGIPLEVREGKLGEPVGVKTRLGWTVYGSSPSECEKEQFESVNHVNIQEDLHELVKSYFSTENFGVMWSGPTRMSDENERAMEIMKKNTKFTGSRYSTGLLWREDKPNLPNNRVIAERRFYSMERKLIKDPVLKSSVSDLFNGYISKGYLEKLSEEEAQSTTNKTWYLPYFFVTNINKPGKIRMVWDAAASYNGTSLNSTLLKGPDMIQPLPAVLQRFREKKVAVTADIKEMFHQILVNPEDQQAQRILWRGDEGKIEEYVMKVMTFGATCSPTLAQYVKNLNADEHGANCPEAQLAIKEDHYVDDWLACFDNVDEAIAVAKQVTETHGKGGLVLGKWASSSLEFMEFIGETNDAVREIQPVERNPETVQVLGMLWDPVTDEFRYRISEELKNSLTGTITKRQVLSLLMKIFDPLGLISFFQVQAKLLLRDVWRSGVNWDEPISDDLYQMWTRWVQWLPNVENIRINRHYGTSDIDPELHIMVDASERAFAAVAYLRRKVNGQYECSLIGSKTRVAPVRALSIPRLELQGAVLGVRLANLILKQHRLIFSSVFYWTDSQNVLCWLRSESRRYRQFVALRIGEILESSQLEQWKYVPSKENVADDATKWNLGDELRHSARWFTGPKFLSAENSSWPIQPAMSIQEGCEEEIGQPVFKTMEFASLVPPAHKFSKFTKLVRATAWALRFFHMLKKGAKHQSLTSEEITEAENEVFRQAQRESYEKEIRHLKENSCWEIPKDSKLANLSPFIDDDKILRMKGRINNAKVATNTKEPIILPRDNEITILLVANYHAKRYHANHETVINDIRQKFVISRLRSLVKKVRQNCQICKNRDAAPANPEMGELPASRLASYTTPFSYVGIDYFGPQEVVVGRRVEKRWGVLFTCLTIRAIHLEIVHSLSANSCIMAIRNFINRRGCPLEIRTDNGTNFRGSANLLEKYGVVNRDQLCDEFPSIRWKFNPPGAPHMGGCWERLVRSVKKSLLAVMKSSRPNDETLRNYYAEVEGVVNSRPLTHIPLEDVEEEALTPNHFLIGNSGGIKPFSPLKTDEVVLRNTWERAQKMTEHFWHRWTTQYLPDLCRRTKWFKKMDPIKVGDLVVIHDTKEPNSWVKGVVETIVKGRRDDQVRQAYVRTNRGVFFRPAAKIAVLSV